MPDDSVPLTQLLNAAVNGDRDAEQQMLTTVYEQMRIQAGKLDARNAVGPTEIVHEVWLRLFHGAAKPQFSNRRAFFAYATRAMRNLIVDHLRKNNKSKKGQGLDRLIESIEAQSRVSFLDLEDALKDLAERNPRRAEIVQLRFFGGLTINEVADELSLSSGTIEREWRLARATLRLRLINETTPE